MIFCFYNLMRREKKKLHRTRKSIGCAGPKNLKQINRRNKLREAEEQSKREEQRREQDRVFSAPLLTKNCSDGEQQDYSSKLCYNVRLFD